LLALLERGVGHFRRHGALAALRHGFVHYGLFPLARASRRVAPEADWYDAFLARFFFWGIHRRWPGDRPLFNDAWVRIRTSGEINDPLRVLVSDKELVKLYVKAAVGDAYNVPTLAVLRSVGEARAFDYPPDCVIKPTHGSGQLILRRGGSVLDLDEIESWFAMNYYRDGLREQNYRTLRPKVIVEPILYGDSRLSDFKFICLRGEPKLIQVDVDRHGNHTRQYFDVEWRRQDFELMYPTHPGVVPRPDNLDDMLRVAAALSRPFGLVRVDLYTDGRQCHVGEITNCHANGCEIFPSAEDERRASRVLFG
jgi:hypothetical protein